MEQKIMEIYHDIHGKWFGYCPETKEYTPAFDNPLMLKRVYEHKGYTMKGRYKHDLFKRIKSKGRNKRRM